MERLSSRLRAIVSLIPPCNTAADIGTDHALLPIYLIQSGIASQVIASDVNLGPYQKAKAYVRLHGLEELIDVRLGNGLSILHPGEAEVVIISGLGGTTIVEILNEGQAALEGVSTIVLNPATHQSEVRHWLRENGWTLSEEELVKDKGKMYQIIRACPGKESSFENWSPLEYDVGPLIIRKRHPLLKEYLSRKLKKYEKVVDNLKQSQSGEAAKKQEKLMSIIVEIKALLTSLSGFWEEDGNDNLQKGDENN